MSTEPVPQPGSVASDESSDLPVLLWSERNPACHRARDILRKYRVSFVAVPGPYVDEPIVESGDQKYRGLERIELLAKLLASHV